ncbi:response regulator transcription factor [Roseateles paludis]|uniref:Response regulator n=1 Tax=Roseateles paludis TaxID=3145238 RepID=A0ABV0G2H7_9BURK
MKKVLIVEDQDDIRELIRVTLEFENFELGEAANGESALAQAKAQRPDLILLDVMMPGGMDGIEVCRRVRGDSGLRKAKIVMLSAKGQQADRAAGYSAGADDYLTKPFSPLELLQVVNKMIG